MSKSLLEQVYPLKARISKKIKALLYDFYQTILCFFYCTGFQKTICWKLVLIVRIRTETRFLLLNRD